MGGRDEFELGVTGTCYSEYCRNCQTLSNPDFEKLNSLENLFPSGLAHISLHDREIELICQQWSLILSTARAYLPRLFLDLAYLRIYDYQQQHHHHHHHHDRGKGLVRDKETLRAIKASAKLSKMVLLYLVQTLLLNFIHFTTFHYYPT